VIHLRQGETAKKQKRRHEQQNPFHGASDNLSFENLFYSRSRGIGLTLRAALLRFYQPHHQRGEVMIRTNADQDKGKGATETENHQPAGDTGLQRQIGHRDQDPMLKDADTDFPEPGENPEHSGEPEAGAA